MHDTLLSPQQAIELAQTPVGETPNRLAAAMKLAGVKQADIVRVTGFTQPYISAVANGRYETITLENARRFAEFFGVAIELLFPARSEAA